MLLDAFLDDAPLVSYCRVLLGCTQYSSSLHVALGVACHTKVPLVVSPAFFYVCACVQAA